MAGGRPAAPRLSAEQFFAKGPRVTRRRATRWDPPRPGHGRLLSKMASESGPEEDSGVVAVFQGGVAQTGQCTFIAELNTTKPVHLGVANDLWDAIELFVAGLRHCQSMLRGDNTVTMDSVTRSLEDTVAHGGLQRAVEASLAVSQRAP